MSKILFDTRSHQLLLIDHKLKVQPQLFGGLAAQEHPLHKDLKIIHHRAIAGIDDQLELNQRLRLVDLQLRLFDGVSDLSAKISAAAMGLTGLPVPSSWLPMAVTISEISAGSIPR